MHIAIRKPNIARENRKGGLWNRRIKKSVAKRLVNKGWSIKPFIIFLNITIPIKLALKGEFLKLRCLFSSFAASVNLKMLSPAAFYNRDSTI